MTFFKSRPQFIAHRGYSECYPENTLVGLEAALASKADGIEFDVQFTRDGVPVVIHDNELKRTTGADGLVTHSTAAQVAMIFAGEPQRFGGRFQDEPVPTLVAVLKLLEQWPKATAFVEIKEESIECFGAEFIAQRLVSELAPFGDRCVLISFDLVVLEVARRLGIRKIGWVVRKWGDETLLHVKKLKPDVVLCNYKKIPDIENALWQGPWRWAVYDVVDPDVALRWIHRGVHIIETWDVGGLLRQQKIIPVLEE